MDSEEDTPYDDIDSGNESSGDEVDFPMEVEANNPRERQIDVDEYPYEVLSTEEIVQHMVDSIKEVNNVVEVSLSYFLCSIVSLPLVLQLQLCWSLFNLFCSDMTHLGYDIFFKSVKKVVNITFTPRPNLVNSSRT